VQCTEFAFARQPIQFDVDDQSALRVASEGDVFAWADAGRPSLGEEEIVKLADSLPDAGNDV
jgi:hypothetical protein